MKSTKINEVYYHSRGEFEKNNWWISLTNQFVHNCKDGHVGWGTQGDVCHRCNEALPDMLKLARHIL